MARKTYESLPDRFRPLPKRFNAIITRDESGMVRDRVVAEWRAARVKERMKDLERDRNNGQDPDAKGGFCTNEHGIRKSVEKEEPAILISNDIESALTVLGRRGIGNALVVGGSEIYASSLKLDPAGSGHGMRIVLTDVRRPVTDSEKADPTSSSNGFECDTFFPIDNPAPDSRWAQVSAAELSDWVGEEVPDGWLWDRDVAIHFLGYRRK